MWNRVLRRVHTLAERPLAVAERAIAERALLASRPGPALAELGRHLLAGADTAVDAPDGRPRFTLVRDFAAYQLHRDRMRGVLARRSGLEKLLAMAGMPLTYGGYEGTLDRPARFLVDLQYGATEDADGTWIPNYRERASSSSTGLGSRQRAMALFLEQRLPPGVDLSGAAIYAMEAVTPFFEHLRRRAGNAVGSEFLGEGTEPGTIRNGIRHEDVTRLSFADASFDLVVSNDVMEHVPDYRRGFTEVLRVLRPGGTLVFTVPFHPDQYENVTRARVGPDGIEHCLPPEYHGDPVNPGGGVLCFQTFGWKLLDELREIGFGDTGAAFTWSYLHGMLGRELSLFFATKSADRPALRQPIEDAPRPAELTTVASGGARTGAAAARLSRCPVCDALDVRRFHEAGGYEYGRCGDCGSISIEERVLARMDSGEPLVPYTDAYWQSELPSARERAHGVALARMAEAVHYARVPIRSFVDVGTGPGFFLDAVARHLPSRAERFHGVEKFPPPPGSRTTSPRYVVGDVADLEFRIDAGTCIEVFEHLTPRMLRGLLGALERASSPGALYIVNTGMPEYVAREDLAYLDPVQRGHVVSYSLEGVRRLCEGLAFQPIAIPGKTWAFVLEHSSSPRAGEDVRDRIWSALPENLELLTDPEMGSVLRLLGMETARAYR